MSQPNAPVPHPLEIITRSFRSRCCPSCGGSKQASHAFCSTCFLTLPVDDRNALYKRFGKGFEPAWREGLRKLGKPEPVMPAEVEMADRKYTNQGGDEYLREQKGMNQAKRLK